MRGELERAAFEEEAREVQQRLEARVEARQHRGRGGARREAGRERHLLHPLPQLAEELSVRAVARQAPQALDDEAEDAVERVVGRELVEGDGEEVAARGPAQRLGDAPAPFEQRQLVFDRLVVTVRAALPLLAQVRGEEARQYLEPVAAAAQQRGERVLAHGQAARVREHVQEVPRRLLRTPLARLRGRVRARAVRLRQHLHGAAAEAHDADVLRRAQLAPPRAPSRAQHLRAGRAVQAFERRRLPLSPLEGPLLVLEERLRVHK